MNSPVLLSFFFFLQFFLATLISLPFCMKFKSGLSISIFSVKIPTEILIEFALNLWINLGIIADGDCSHEIKRCLLLGRKVITNLGSILKRRNITLPTKVHLVKAMVFPVVMYGCESWTIKKMNTEELMLLNCGVGEDSWESFGLQGEPTSPS